MLLTNLKSVWLNLSVNSYFKVEVFVSMVQHVYSSFSSIFAFMLPGIALDWKFSYSQLKNNQVKQSYKD